MTHVPDIIRLEKEAEELETEASRCRWEAAGLMVEELDAGTSQRRLAEGIGKSQSHVKLCAKVWREYLGTRPIDRPDWNTAYQAAKRTTPVGVPSPDCLPAMPAGSKSRRGLTMLDTVPDDAAAPVLRIASALRDIANGDNPERAFLHACQAVTDLAAQ